MKWGPHTFPEHSLTDAAQHHRRPICLLPAKQTNGNSVQGDTRMRVFSLLPGDWVT